MDRIKQVVANAVTSCINDHVGRVIENVLEHQVTDVAIHDVAPLENMIVVKGAGGPRRHFLVKVSEQL